MAVALATLPLNSRAVDESDSFLLSDLEVAASTLGADLTGTGLARLAVLPVDFAGLLATFFSVRGFFTTAAFGLGFLVAVAFTGGVFFTAGLFVAAFFVTTFFVAAFFATAFFAAAFTTTDFDGFAATFLLAALPADGFGADFLTATTLPDFLATAFFGATLLLALATFPVALVALLVGGFLPAGACDLVALTSFVLAEAVPFFALAAVELRVVFAISLTVFWPWRPGVIAQVGYTSKPASGILAYPHTVNCFGNVNCLDSNIAFSAPRLQALAQPPAGTTMPLLPQLLRLCTDCHHSIRPLAWQPARRLAAVALPALVYRWRGPGARTLSLPPLSLPMKAPGTW